MICSNHGAAARGFLSCANNGTIGVAAGAAKLMKLDRAKIRDAVTLAASVGGGLVRQTGSAAHVVEAGFAGRDGIMAATLAARGLGGNPTILDGKRSEERTSELQSLMRNSYAVFCLKKNKHHKE